MCKISVLLTKFEVTLRVCFSMEHTYYPSIKRILLAFLVLPIGTSVVYLVFWAFNINTNPSQAGVQLLFAEIMLISLILWAIWSIFRYGFRAFQRDNFAIKISSSSIDVPNLRSGKRKTIAFNKIDIQKTLTNRSIYCLDGTEVVIDGFLFQPKQIDEIFAAIEEIAEGHATQQ